MASKMADERGACSLPRMHSNGGLMCTKYGIFAIRTRWRGLSDCRDGVCNDGGVT